MFEPIWNFINSNFISGVFGSAIGVFLTFYFINKRDKKKLKMHAESILILLFEELTPQLDLLGFHKDKMQEVIIKMPVWESNKFIIREIYPQLFLQYNAFKLDLLAAGTIHIGLPETNEHHTEYNYSKCFMSAHKITETIIHLYRNSDLINTTELQDKK